MGCLKLAWLILKILKIAEFLNEILDYGSLFAIGTKIENSIWKLLGEKIYFNSIIYSLDVGNRYGTFFKIQNG